MDASSQCISYLTLSFANGYVATSVKKLMVIKIRIRIRIRTRINANGYVARLIEPNVC